MSSMFTSPDEARSDLFLSAAVYLLGPLVLDVVLRIVPLARIPALAVVITVLQPFVVTALTPLLLMRHRGERLASYGISAGNLSRLAPGALLALPVVVASAVGAALDGEPLTAFPVLGAGPGGLLSPLYRLVSWLGLAFLGSYATVKARDAFFSDTRSVRAGVEEIGRYLAIAAAASTALLFVAGLRGFTVLLLPLGVAGTVLLLRGQLRGPATTTRAVLLTPVVLLALGPFALTLRADVFVVGVWAASLVGGIGLVLGALQETRGSAMPALGLALVLALATTLGPSGFLG